MLRDEDQRRDEDSKREDQGRRPDTAASRREVLSIVVGVGHLIAGTPTNRDRFRDHRPSSAARCICYIIQAAHIDGRFRLGFGIMAPDVADPSGKPG
jgi:hypothetical protein